MAGLAEAYMYKAARYNASAGANIFDKHITDGYLAVLNHLIAHDFRIDLHNPHFRCKPSGFIVGT